MGKVNITWVQGKQFIGTDSTNHSVVISSADEGVGMKPSELLLVALGSCTAYDVVNILTKKRFRLHDVKITVDGEQDDNPPWVFKKIHIHYCVAGVDIKAEDVEKAIKLSKEKYCSVSATLAAAADITFDFEVAPSE